MIVKSIAEAETELKDFIGSLLDSRGHSKQFSMSENLVAAGKLDSLAIVEIIVFLEGQYNFSLDKIDFNPKLFERGEDILKLCQDLGYIA